MANLWQDLRHAWRALWRSGGFTTAAVLLLALGIGANTAVFSVVHAVLLRPLPYPQPDRLVKLLRQPDSDVSIPEFQFWRDNSSAYESVAGMGAGAMDTGLDTGSAFQWIKVTRVTQNFLRTLGVTPALGREFDAVETRAGGPQAIILTDGLWRRTFGTNREVLGRSVLLGNSSYTVVGVLPPDLWLDASPDALVPLQPSGRVSDQGTNTVMIGRLKAGVSLAQASAEQADLTRRFLATGAIQPVRGYQGLAPVSYQASLNSGIRTNLLFLAGAVGLLLLIACSNLAGLLLARMAGRAKEFAVRLALGSSTRKLLWQSLVENLLLSIAGGLAGLLVGSWMLEALLALAPYALRTASPIALDQPVLWFTIAVALMTCLLVSAAPLLTVSRADIAAALKSGRQGAPGRSALRAMLVTGQVALTVMLLVCASLLIQTLYRLHLQELGFSPQDVMTFYTPNSARNSSSPAAWQSFESTMLDRLRGLPGVRSVAAANALPLVDFNNFPTQRVGHSEQSVGGMEIRRVSPEYFATMGIRILRGRAFTAEDSDTSLPVILVNQTLARQWWGSGEPLGDRVAIGRYKGKDLGPKEAIQEREVVGVVADTRRTDLKDPPRATVYIPDAQSDSAGPGTHWVLRGTFPPDFAEKLRQAVAEADPRGRVDKIQRMDQIVTSSTASSRFNAWLFGSFAGIALLLTAAGIYGLLAFSVARRTQEIGTRMALGASRARVIGMVLWQSLVLIVIGLAAGLAAGAAAARSLQSLLFEVRPKDPFSYAAVAAILLAVGLLAAYVPARRASRVDPMVALRTE